MVAVGGKIVRPAAGTLTRRGRPPVGDQPKQLGIIAVTFRAEA
jgi:hypothetical protein